MLFDISRVLNTGLNRQTLTTLVELTESGVNPEALATVVKELRRESAELQAAQAIVVEKLSHAFNRTIGLSCATAPAEKDAQRTRIREPILGGCKRAEQSPETDMSRRRRRIRESAAASRSQSQGEVLLITTPFKRRR